MNTDHDTAGAALLRWHIEARRNAAPLRFALIEAMARRGSMLAGEARRRHDARMLQLIVEYPCDRTDTETAHVSPASDSMTRLLDHMRNGARLESPDSLPSACYPELPLLGEFRALWTQLRTEGQMQAALQPAETDAGPLNSGRLIQRSLTLMREVSPGYLQHFIQYVDTLLSLDSMRAAESDSPNKTPAETKRTARKRAPKTTTR